MSNQLVSNSNFNLFPKFYIYKITFDSGKTYVGQHTQYVENDSYITSSSYYKRNKNIDKIKSREILIVVNDKFTLDLMETICIFEDKASNPNNVNYNWGGYANGMIGGWNKGIKMSQGFGDKIREIQKKIPHRKGFKHTDETRKKMSKAHTGFKHTEESIKKMSESKKGHAMDEHTKQKLSEANVGRIPWNKEKAWSDEMKKKLSDAHIGQKPWNLGIKATDEAKKKKR